MATTQAPTPQKTSFLKRLFARKSIAQGTTKYRPTRQPDHPKQARQVRKRAWLHGGSPYVPIFFNLDSTGLNHRQRRSHYASSRGKAVDEGRKKKRIRGEYCGRKLERLIRAGAPLGVVQSLRWKIRDFLDNQ
jgi:hypothetical protein